MLAHCACALYEECLQINLQFDPWISIVTMSNEDLSWANGRSSSPVSIPRSSDTNGGTAADLHRSYVAKSAPNQRRHIEISTRTTLIDPVVEESEVLITSSSVRSDSGFVHQSRRREAELGDLSSARHYGTSAVYKAGHFGGRGYGGSGGGPGAGGEGEGGEPIIIPHELEQSSEALLEDYVKIAVRNKRAEHATTYALCVT